MSWMKLDMHKNTSRAAELTANAGLQGVDFVALEVTA